MSRADVVQMPLFLEPDIEDELQRARWLWRALFETVRLWGGRPLVASEDNVEARFWHVVTAGAAVRRLDRVRIAGVGRMWYLLDSLSRGEPSVRWWVEESSGRGRRYFVAPDDFTFLVILKACGEGFAVVTAYCCASSREHYAARHAGASENDSTGMRPCLPRRSRRRSHPDHPMWRRIDGVYRVPSLPIPADVRTRGGGLPSSQVEDHYATAVAAARRAARQARRVARGQE